MDENNNEIGNNAIQSPEFVFAWIFSAEMRRVRIRRTILLGLIMYLFVKFRSDYYKMIDQIVLDSVSVEVDEATTDLVPLPAPPPLPAQSTKVEPKIILFYTKWWFKQYPFIEEAKNRCPHCMFTEDRKLFNASQAVVFFGRTIQSHPPPTKFRTPNQIWVWLHLEAPAYWDVNKLYWSSYLNVFNWTMTYRKDADIYVPYGQVVPKAVLQRPSFNETWAFLPRDVGLTDYKRQEIYDERLLNPPTIDELKGRRLVAWIVGSCGSQSRRMLIAKALRKYIDVDIYGKCGSHSCRFSQAGMSTSGNPGIDCRIQISNKYKFYLAFENGVCEDYVTEKYFDTYFTQMVPVVYGGVNYSSLAPNSYINLMDFKNVRQLANHLKYLDQNPKEYLKHFEWKKDYWVKNNGYLTGWCSLCAKLWAETPKQRTYENVHEWWTRRSDFKESGKESCMDRSETTRFINIFAR